MMTFQVISILLIITLLILVVAHFRRSSIILIGGLIVIGLFTLASLVIHTVTLEQLGLNLPKSWLWTFGLAMLWLVLMIAYSPLADRLAAYWYEKPPRLEAFRAIQPSRGGLIAGIIAAWLLGGFLEELIARGIVLKSFLSLLAAWLPASLAAVVAIIIAAIGAGLMHIYQGPRAVVITTQLSILFGILFVLSRYNLWPVIICHGLYDTVAFVRFANKKSKYSDLDDRQANGINKQN